jgi:hypothetical protein
MSKNMSSFSKLNSKNPASQIKYRTGRKIGMELYAIPPKFEVSDEFNISKYDIEIKQNF